LIEYLSVNALESTLSRGSPQYSIQNSFQDSVKSLLKARNLYHWTTAQLKFGITEKDTRRAGFETLSLLQRNVARLAGIRCCCEFFLGVNRKKKLTVLTAYSVCPLSKNLLSDSEKLSIVNFYVNKDSAFLRDFHYRY
jgi:hypothetical protein